MAHDPKPGRIPDDAQLSPQPDACDRFCIDCRYPLVGLSHPACPECGRGFDPGDPTTFSPNAKPAMWEKPRPFDAITAVGWSLPMVLFLLNIWIGNGSRWWWRSHVLGGIWFLFLIGIVAFVVCNTLTKHRRSPTDGLLGAAAFIGLVLAGQDPYTIGLYVLFASFALVVMTAMRTFRSDGWWSCGAAVCTLLVICWGMLLIWNSVTFSVAIVADYWTYWFWTAQRF